MSIRLEHHQALDACLIDPQATFTPENTYRDDQTDRSWSEAQPKGGFGAQPACRPEGEVLAGDTWPKRGDTDDDRCNFLSVIRIAEDGGSSRPLGQEIRYPSGGGT
jgi:hypothetical protein